MTWDWVTRSCTNFLEPKKVFTYEEGSARTKRVWNSSMATVLLFWNTNMAAVTSCENALYSQFHLVDTSPNHLYNNNNNNHHHHHHHHHHSHNHNHNNGGDNFSHLPPMAKLQRNQRGQIGRQHVKAYYAAASVHVWYHLAHPDQ